MLNFKFFKRASVLFVLAFVLFSHNVSLAQERINQRDSEMAVLIESAEIKTGEDGIEIKAILFNPSPATETPLATYLLILENIDPLVKSKDLDYTPSALIVAAQEGGDYFSLKPNERKTVKYLLPVSQYLPVANYAFNMRFMQRSGNIVGQHREILRDFGFNRKKSSQGNYEKGFLAFFKESCVILNAKGEKFEPNEGPIFNPSEQPKARCMVKNIGDEDITVSPKIEWKEFFVYGRPSSGAKLEEKLPDIFIFKKGETKLVEVFLPMAQKPQVYQALLSFNDESASSADERNDKRSFDMPFRWTIGGSSARVEEISLISPIKNIYNKGETISLSVDYFGSMDLYWRNSSDELAGLAGLKMLAVVKDENDEICGQKELDLPDINDSGRNNQIIDIVLDEKCENVSYSVSVSSNNEKLAEEMAEVPKTAEAQTNKIYYYIGALILFLALLVMAIKRRKKAIVSAVMFFSVFAVFGLFSNSADASATKTYDKGSAYSAGYGGYDEEKSAPLYSFYGVNDTTNINKLVIDDIYADIDTDLNGFHVDIYYAAGFTSCSNSTMHIRFKMYVEADGIKKPVNFAPEGSINYQSKQIVEFTSKTYGVRDDYFDIDPASLKNFYDSDIAKKLKSNPRLIIEIVQSGKSTHTNSYHRGDFSKPVSTADFSSRSAAFDASDTIKYVIPLNLPAPSVNLTATPAKVAPPNDNVSVKLDTTDMTECKFRYNGSPAFDGLTFDAPLENGTKSQEKTVSHVWSPSVSTTVQNNELAMDCTRNLGSSIGKGSYSASATVDVNSPNYKITINNSPSSSTGASATVKASFSWPTTITTANAVKNIFNRAEAFGRDSSKHLAVSADVTCDNGFPCVIYAPEGAGVTLTATVTNGKIERWDLPVPLSCSGGPTSNPCSFTMPKADIVSVFKLGSSSTPPPSSSSSCSGAGCGGGSNYNLTVNIGGNCTGSIYNKERSDSTGGTKTYTKYSSGDKVTLTATNGPNSGQTCKMTGGWSTASGGNCVGGTLSTNNTSNDTCNFNMGSADKSLSVSFDSSSVSSDPDPGTFNLTVIQTGSGSGSVSLKHMGSLDGNDGGLDSNVSGISPWGLAKDWIFQITATPSSGSSLGGVSGGGCGNSPCTITMDSNKTVTVTFNSDTGCCGGGAVEASISARNNPVPDGETTTIDWGSTNATSCAHTDSGLGSGSYKDTGWLSAGNTTSGNYETKAFTTSGSGGSRTYTIECTNGSQSDTASVTVDVGNSDGVSSVDIWAEDSEVKNKGTTMIKWSSSNISGDCLLYSADDTLGGYLDLLTTNYFGYGNYKTVPQNNTVGKKTGNLTSDAVYKIACHKESNYSERVTDSTTVTVAAPVSDFTFTNTTGAMTATIVEGLSANSSSATLAFIGSAVGKVNLSASVPSKFGSGAKVQFSTNDGVSWSDAPLNNIDISITSQVKLKVINIPGNTATGTYSVAITAKDDKRAPKLNINLQVKKVSSEWEEF